MIINEVALGAPDWVELYNGTNATVDLAGWVLEWSAIDAGNPVTVQWTYGSSDDYWDYCGWNIDDVVIEGAMVCQDPPDPPFFVGSFEDGTCDAWSWMTP